MYKVQNYNKRKKLFCLNCGKSNHVYNDCCEPSCSYGIICFYSVNSLINDLQKILKINENKTYNQNFHLNSINNAETIDKINKLLSYLRKNENKYHLLMIRRKHTLSYVEFLRGKYDINNIDYIKTLFLKMSNDEIQNIINLKDFTKLRIDLGMQNKKKKYYKSEYETAEIKFNYLKKLQIFKELNIDNLKSFDEPEWEIPKGKRQSKETDLQCAIREFSEESGISASYLKIFKNVLPLEEIYTGSNGIDYKNTYFFAELNNLPLNIFYIEKFINNIKFDIKEINFLKFNKIEIELNNFSSEQKKEVSKINLLNQNESLNKLRKYQINKKNIITKAFQIINQYQNYFNV